MNEKSEISEVEQIIQSDKISQEKSQDDSQGLPLGQGTPMDGRKEEESGSYTHTDTDFDDDESEEEIDSDLKFALPSKERKRVRKKNKLEEKGGGREKE